MREQILAAISEWLDAAQKAGDYVVCSGYSDWQHLPELVTLDGKFNINDLADRIGCAVRRAALASLGSNTESANSVIRF